MSFRLNLYTPIKVPYASLLENFSLLLFLLIIPLTYVLPPEIAWENGPIENSQVIVLLLGAIYNICTALKSRQKGTRPFCIFCAVILILMAIRELSFGRVFFPLGVDVNGPYFAEMEDLPFKTAMDVFMGCCYLFLLYMMVRRMPWRKIFTTPMPVKMIVLLVITLILSQVGEHNLLFHNQQSMILEELGELSFYLQISFLTYYYAKAWEMEK